MANNESVKDRLKQYISFLNLSQSRFEKACGLSNGYVNNIRVSIQPKALQRIALQFPELNTGWLLTGEGDMLKKDEPYSVSVVELKGAVQFYKELAESRLDQIVMLQKRLDELTAMIEDMRKSGSHGHGQLSLDYQTTNRD